MARLSKDNALVWAVPQLVGFVILLCWLDPAFRPVIGLFLFLFLAILGISIFQNRQTPPQTLATSNYTAKAFVPAADIRPAPKPYNSPPTPLPPAPAIVAAPEPPQTVSAADPSSKAGHGEAYPPPTPLPPAPAIVAAPEPPQTVSAADSSSKRGHGEAYRRRQIRLLPRSSRLELNPREKRTLSLNEAHKRGEYLIPLNVDGLKPTELDWITSDLAFIASHRTWAHGLTQLLKKLQAASASRLGANGGQIAAETCLPANLILEKQEVLTSNSLRFERIPGGLHCFSQTRRLTDEENADLPRHWPFYRLDPKTVLSFFAPPAASWNDAFKQEARARAHFGPIKGTPITNIVSSLLRKSAKMSFPRLGCGETGDHKAVFIPSALTPDDEITFEHDGRKTWLKVRGHSRLSGIDELSQRCYHHLAFSHRIRQALIDRLVRQMTASELVAFPELGGLRH